MKKTMLLGLVCLSLGSFAQNKKWKPLFDGKTLTGWHNFKEPGKISDKWVIDDGSIHLTSKGGGDILSDGDYEDFVLQYEWKISEGGNSGVMWGCSEEAKYLTPWVTGPEMQVLDDAKHPDSFAGKNGNHKAGALYDMMPPMRLDAVKPANQWNVAEMRINHKKNQGIFKLNGIITAKFDLSGTQWEAMKAESKFKTMPDFGRVAKGKICLQDHGDKVWFRNIRIKEL
jgi:Domain of Unknown Function (DUF1080)